MKAFIRLFIFIAVISLCAGTKAQSDDKFEKLREIPLDLIQKMQPESKSKPQQEEGKLHSNDSIFNLYDVDIDLALGEISIEQPWGDPVKNPQIRCNRASNLYGPVRHNADGSIRWHRGFDYYAPKGTPVYSVGNGVVSLVQKHPDYGLCVLITHKRPKKTYYSFYAHLSSVSVKYGQKVKKGSKLGKSGTTGNAYNLTGNEEHLHFEYRTSPKHGDRKQENPNAIVKTKFYSADPKNKWQTNVGVIKKSSKNLFE